jgi:hypothetical protein
MKGRWVEKKCDKEMLNWIEIRRAGTAFHFYEWTRSRLRQIAFVPYHRD